MYIYIDTYIYICMKNTCEVLDVYIIKHAIKYESQVYTNKCYI